MAVAVSVHPFGMNIMFEFDPAKALESTKQLCEFCPLLRIFPQQRKLIGSSAQNRSGVHWCRRRVRFNEVPEKVPKVQEKVWEALPEKVPGGFGAEPGQVQQGSGEGSGGVRGFRRSLQDALVVRFNMVQWVPEKVAEKVPEKVLGIFGTGPGQVQQVQQGFQRLASQHASEKIVKMKSAAVGDTTETVFQMCNLVRLLAMNPVVLLICSSTPVC